MNRAFKYKLYVDKKVEDFFARCCGVTRLIYNVALTQRDVFWRAYHRAEEKHISYVSQARELTALRAEFDWIHEIPIDAQQQALRDLHQAYQNFFNGVSKYPTPRKKFVNESFRIPASRVGDVEILNAKWARIKLPKIGSVKFRYTRALQGAVRNVTIIREANGWHVVLVCEFDHVIPANDKPAVGIDRGITNTYALSTGVLETMPVDHALIEQHKTWQRIAARRKTRSKRQMKAKRHAARLAAKAARKRQHWQHVHTKTLAERFGVAVIEDLKIRNMSKSAKGTIEAPSKNVAQKRGLNRSILASAWFRFETLLRYKMEACGGRVIKVDPKYTSMTCVECRSREKGNRENQAKFACLSCGHEDHADVNAARNILRAGTQPAGVKTSRELKRAA